MFGRMLRKIEVSACGRSRWIIWGFMLVIACVRLSSRLVIDSTVGTQ